MIARPDNRCARGQSSLGADWPTGRRRDQEHRYDAAAPAPRPDLHSHLRAIPGRPLAHLRERSALHRYWPAAATRNLPFSSTNSRAASNDVFGSVGPLSGCPCRSGDGNRQKDDDKCHANLDNENLDGVRDRFGATVARTATMLALASACLMGAAGPVLALDAKLHCNGVYWAAPDERGAKYRYYLRFYPDGTVLAVTSNGQPTDLKQWFTPEHPDVAAGRYALDGNHIGISVTPQGGLFSETSRFGAIVYGGSLDGNELRLSTLSPSDQHRKAGPLPSPPGTLEQQGLPMSWKA